MNKRFQAARIEMSKRHGLERVNFEIALRGWYNPRKFGHGPSLPVPPTPDNLSLMSPQLKLSMARSAYYSELSGSSGAPSPPSTPGKQPGSVENG